MSKIKKELDAETLAYAHKALIEGENISAILKYGNFINSQYVYNITKFVGSALTEELAKKYNTSVLASLSMELGVISFTMSNICKVNGNKCSQAIDFANMILKDRFTCDKMISVRNFLESGGDIRDISYEYSIHHIMILSLCLEQKVDYKPILNPNLDYAVVKDYLVKQPYITNTFIRLKEKTKAFWDKRRKLNK